MSLGDEFLDSTGAEFEAVSSFGRYRFGLSSCRQSSFAIVATREEGDRFRSAEFAAKDFERYTVLVRQNRAK